MVFPFQAPTPGHDKSQQIKSHAAYKWGTMQTNEKVWPISHLCPLHKIAV